MACAPIPVDAAGTGVHIREAVMIKPFGRSFCAGRSPAFAGSDRNAPRAGAGACPAAKHV